MIAKITRGFRVGDLAAYLHGPGKANEHTYTRDARTFSGGVVIGGNLGREGDTNGTGWAQDVRAAAGTRPEIVKPVWQVSLRVAPGDRRLSDQEWADAGQTFAERMGFAEHPWVMVRHGEDHVHIVTSRVSEVGQVWHARQDYRHAQRAATQLEQEYGLQPAPRVKADRAVRVSRAQSQGRYREQASVLIVQRAEALARGREVLAQAGVDFPRPPEAAVQPPASTVEAERTRRARGQTGRDTDRGPGR